MTSLYITPLNVGVVSVASAVAIVFVVACLVAFTLWLMDL